MITETIILEVTDVSTKTHYPMGYDKPSETLTMIRLCHNEGGRESNRQADIVIPGNLPIGTRFKLNIEQVDEVTSATIHRGALPNIDESKLLRGTKDEIQ